jgi:hypothetical protein
MIEVPEHFNPVDARDIREAQRLAKAAGFQTFYAVEQLVARFIANREQLEKLLNEHHRERERLGNIIARLGGGFDRRGLEGEPRGLMVQHGIHTVIEDS